MEEAASLVRPFMKATASPLCPDFHTFLRLVCTGEIYRRGNMLFLDPPSE